MPESRSVACRLDSWCLWVRVGRPYLTLWLASMIDAEAQTDQRMDVVKRQLCVFKVHVARLDWHNVCLAGWEGQL